MLKAAWKAEKGEDDQYFCVDDDEEEEGKKTGCWTYLPLIVQPC